MSEANTQTPLVVDLDGTLVTTDTLWECLLKAVRMRPLVCLLAPLWLLAGRAQLKQRLATIACPDPRLLPYHDEVLAFVRQEAETGRPIILATGADQRVATAVSDHLGIFTASIASDGTTNCTGSVKAKQLRERYPDGFDYIGNAPTDLKVWQVAQHAHVVSRGQKLARQAAAVSTVGQTFQTSKGLRPWIKLMRPHQWPKNALVLIPMLLAHRFDDPLDWLTMIAAMASFSFVASTIYIVNDSLDIEADRAHSSKKRRPLAAGRVSIPLAAATAVTLLLAGLGLGWVVNGPLFLALLLLYLVLTTAYTMVFKRQLIVDAIVLAGLYCLRILAGSVALTPYVSLSPWLLAFSMFFFFGLAMAKRYADLVTLEKQEAIPGRAYHHEDGIVVVAVGAASSLVSVLVVCLYIARPEVTVLYEGHLWLWCLCPTLMYWLSRIWIIAGRGELNHDPVAFALTDKVSYAIGLLTLALLAAATTIPL